MWFFCMFMEKLASAVQSRGTSLKQKRNLHRTKKWLRTGCEVGNYFLSTYTTNEAIAQRDAEMTMSSQPPNMNSVEYSQSIWLKELKCGSVYDE